MLAEYLKSSHGVELFMSQVGLQISGRPFLPQRCEEVVTGRGRAKQIELCKTDPPPDPKKGSKYQTC